MLVMETITKIRRQHYVEGKGIRAISRSLRLSRNTVKKVLRSNKTDFQYSPREHQSYRALGNYIERLEALLREDMQEPKRRRRTTKKIFQELQAEGYEGSYDAVHDYAKQWRLKNSRSLVKAFVPLEFEAGEAFQFDWSEEEIELGGILTRIKVAHIRLCYSRYFLMVAYPNEQLEMVLDAHNQAFSFFGGSCCKGIYDNMKTAIKTVLRGKEREYNARFLQMCSHHLFEPIACTPSSGWEKGQVENQVNTGRCNFFTPLVKVDTLEALNVRLREWCTAWAKSTAHPEWKAKTVFEVYQEEAASLIPYRGPFDSYKVIHEVVSPYSFIQYATNSYSVEIKYVGQSVQIRVYAYQIVIIYQESIIGHHVRCFGRYQRIYDPWHYVPLLETKPGALRNGAPFKKLALPVAMQTVRKQLANYSDGEKQFIRILLEVTHHGLQAIEEACKVALTQGGCNATLILSYLKPSLEKPLEEPLKLSAPPTEECHIYNQAYLSQTMKQEVASYAI